MDRSDVITLLSVSYQLDSSGTEHAVVTRRRNVFCQIASIGMKESYTAMSVGHNPEVKATIAEHSEYDGETFVLYAGDVFKVLRTYRKSLAIELTLERTNDLSGVI